ncbi:cytochrome c nitrite reductase subunit NrfD [Enterobacillus tribolii]|uniref:Respiratory nitrite reductase-specific menaquinol--cytochrome-c reductase complex subunit NrfD n=1 Tax=Enterobacillus tribolii TaxID=1487935 RepID=A0A370QN91_9GAMM|nr:cytochrome c nitrite reductase subunit NrfD [Enterobacillus tribolii]MBW7982137.1 cytochrome c nitrite reductase subunit NrfD [Enterobacillus tribolii]RDK89841.1 respiratory nitrite reductase-specific menaquinol--cytochrome-c reductase complex subunit NrfD [Enterobacillus tribolii]
MNTTTSSAFHFPSLVWDWPIAIYLFLIGISAGLVTVAILLRRYHPQAGTAQSGIMRTTAIVAPLSIIVGLVILIFHLTRPWTFWKLMFHYSFTSVMSMGVMLFQVYTVVLLVWLAIIFHEEVAGLQRRFVPRMGWINTLVSRLAGFTRGLENLLMVLAVLLGAYTGFLLSALKSYPFLNNPVLPALFLFSGVSSGISVAILTAVKMFRVSPDSQEIHFVHRLEKPVVGLEIFLLAAFLIGLLLGGGGKEEALMAAVGGGFWAWWFWVGVVGIGLVLPLLVRMVWRSHSSLQLWLTAGASLCGVLLLRFFVLYAGQMTVV